MFPGGKLSLRKPGSFSVFSRFLILASILAFVWLCGVVFFISSSSRANGDASLDAHAVPIKPTNTTNVLLPNGDNTIGEKPLPTPIKAADAEVDENDLERRTAVKEAMKHAWNSYVRHAFGHDEVKPISKRADDNWGGTAATLVDALDTLWIMDLQEEFEVARHYVRDTLTFEVDWDASTFETTIRYLGGLLSTYELTGGDQIFLTKAKEIADKLLPAFRTSSGIPYATVNLKTGNAYSPSWTGGSSFLAEFGTLQLEWRKLSELTGDPTYAEKVNKIVDTMLNADTSNWDGLYPTQFNPQTGTFTGNHITFGARGDSFYEYLLKQWLITYKTDEKVKEVYDSTMVGMIKRLVLKTPGGLTWIAELQNNNHIQKMDHLACFVAGMLALDDNPEHLPLAEEIGYTCWQFYERNPTGIAPEIAGFDITQVHHRKTKDFFNQAPHYLLRPETVESLMILYRVTGNAKYKEWGWKIFQSIEEHCRVEGGYSGIRDVGVVPVQHDDRMESFFLAETLKYLYLLFSPKTTISLDEYVFNTEAHPLRKYKAKKE